MIFWAVATASMVTGFLRGGSPLIKGPLSEAKTRLGHEKQGLRKGPFTCGR